MGRARVAQVQVVRDRFLEPGRPAVPAVAVVPAAVEAPVMVVVPAAGRTFGEIGDFKDRRKFKAPPWFSSAVLFPLPGVQERALAKICLPWQGI